MLNECILGWYGKLPLSNDFIQSDNCLEVISYLKKWIDDSYMHMGESLLGKGSLITSKKVYFFQLAEDVMPNTPIRGIVFSSQDARGRSHPFFIFEMSKSSLEEMWFHFKEKIVAYLNLDFESLLPEEVYLNLMKYSGLIDTLSVKQFHWIELVTEEPKKIHVWKNTPVLYRKLFLT